MHNKATLNQLTSFRLYTLYRQLSHEIILHYFTCHPLPSRIAELLTLIIVNLSVSFVNKTLTLLLSLLLLFFCLTLFIGKYF
jgi:hypothetical protein